MSTKIKEVYTKSGENCTKSGDVSKYQKWELHSDRAAGHQKHQFWLLFPHNSSQDLSWDCPKIFQFWQYLDKCMQSDNI